MLFPVTNVLNFHITAFRSISSVQKLLFLFFGFWMSRFPGILLGYFLHDFQMVWFAPIITGYHFCYKELGTRSVEKQREIEFGFRKTATAVMKRIDRYTFVFTFHRFISYCKVVTFQSVFGFFLDHISLS